MTTQLSRERFAWSKKTKALAVGFLAAGMMMAASPAHASTTYFVNDNLTDGADLDPDDGVCDSDPGPQFKCTLRAAIEEANNTPGADRIEFRLPSAQAIRPLKPLPFITDQVTIDGYTQSGSSPNILQNGDNAVLKVELDGELGNGSGLDIAAGSNTVIRGLVINDFAGSGIQIRGNTLGVHVEGNFIGTDRSGVLDRGNGNNGVDIDDDSGGGAHVIGGTSPASRNIISGNGIDGVSIGGDGGSNRVEGNYVGTDKNGTAVFGIDDPGNANNGVGIIGDTESNTVGGTTPGAGNVISGNNVNGVSISGFGRANKVLGNRIGTDTTGTKDLGNFSSGVSISGVAENTIGDGTAAGANIIAFNGSSFTGGGGGVQINGAGPDPNNANANRILRNSIFSNQDRGIVLGSGGGAPLPNDTGDKDVGPNGFQNFPVITSANTTSTATTISAKLNSETNTSYIVQFFSNPSGGDEGKTFIGQKTVTTDLSGNVSFTFQPASKVAAGQTITATATRNFFNIPSNTSEFSAPRTVASSTAALDTTKISGPSGKTKSKSATFEFESSDPDATFECSLDKETYYECSSPKTISGLSAKKHTFLVRAIDEAGNVDSTPAEWKWKVKKRK